MTITLLDLPHGKTTLSFELGLKETTGPTGGTQKGECKGGPTNGQAAACRRRLAAKAKPRPQGRASSFIFHLASFYFSFGASSSPTNRALRPHHQPHTDLSRYVVKLARTNRRACSLDSGKIGSRPSISVAKIVAGAFLQAAS